jgi:hypothetical protein
MDPVDPDSDPDPQHCSKVKVWIYLIVESGSGPISGTGPKFLMRKKN